MAVISALPTLETLRKKRFGILHLSSLPFSSGLLILPEDRKGNPVKGVPAVSRLLMMEFVVIA